MISIAALLLPPILARANDFRKGDDGMLESEML